MADALDFKDWEAFTKRLARRLMQRSERVGCRLSFDEAYSEMCLCWVQCRDGYDPEQGTFQTYFFRASINWLRNMRVRIREDNQSGKSARLDDQIGRHQGDPGMALHETISDLDYVNPETRVLRDEAHRHMARNHPLLARLIKIIRDQPEDVMQELTALQAKMAMEGEGTAPKALSITLLIRIFDLNWRYRAMLNQSIKESISHVA